MHRKYLGEISTLLCCVATLAAHLASQGGVTQPLLGHRSVPLLTVDGLSFKDLNRNGHLDPYEDWRLPAEARAADLAARMSLEELAGTMVHGSLPSFGPLGQIGIGQKYDDGRARQMIAQQHVNSFITRLTTDAHAFARENNRIQELAEDSPPGIPVTISSDPRHHFQRVLGASDRDLTFSAWPEPLGFGAINDPVLTRHFADVVRQEYLAVGIRESLAPQADLATEPRWARINGTFGEDAEIAKRMVNAYVSGIQNGDGGLNPNSVLGVVKHWAGYGAVKDGWDSHNYYGRYAEFESQRFAYHLIPFTGAFDAHVASVMPTYPILQGVTVNGKPLERVAAGYNQQLIGDLLRGQFGFRGVVLSDWAIAEDCNERCRDGAPSGSTPTSKDIGMPWGVESLSKAERFSKAINAGVDQIGGTEQSQYIVEGVRNGSISKERVLKAATRILVQKFEMGLFENPYADESKAAQIARKASFQRAGEEAQARAVVLLENNRVPGSDRALLPLTPSGTKVLLFGIDGEVARKMGLTVVSNAKEADVAIVHAPAPFQSEHPGYFFGSRQHEGRLNFIETDAGYVELQHLSGKVPVVFVTTLERPLLLANVKDRVTSLVGDFGIADGPLMEVLIGKLKPQGRLPFELPSSSAAVAEQKSDLPHDSKQPLYPFRFGLQY